MSYLYINIYFLHINLTYISPFVRLLGHIAVLFLVYKEISTLFSTMGNVVYIPSVF